MSGLSEVAQSRMEDALYERRARICQALADPKRLRLIEELREGERSVGDLADALGISYPNASQHLTVMREAGLVSTRREGSSVFYRLAYPRIAEACDIVRDILRDQLMDAAQLAAQ